MFKTITLSETVQVQISEIQTEMNEMEGTETFNREEYALLSDMKKVLSGEMTKAQFDRSRAYDEDYEYE